MRRAWRIPLARKMRPMAQRVRTSAMHRRPLALIWRKRSRSAPPNLIARAVTIARSTFSPRSALQLNFRSVLQRPGAGERQTTAATVFHRRYSDLRQTLLTSALRSIEATERRRSTLRTLRTNLVHWRTHRMISSEIVRGLQSKTVDRLISQASRQLPAKLGGRPNSPKIAHHADLISRRVPERFAWRTARRDFARSPAAESQARQGSAKTLLANPFSKIELAWRSEDQSQALQVIERSIASAATLPISVAPTRTMQFEHLPEAAARTAHQALDPALIDRVAEDVIGRVERRIRIERERRGV